MNDTQMRSAAVFLVVFAAIVAVGGVVGVLSDDGAEATELPEIENPQYDADRVSPDTSPGEATVQMDTSAVDNTVVVAVGGRTMERDIEPLVNALVESGNEVNVVSKQSSAPVRGPVAVPEPRQPRGPPPQPGGGDESRLGEELENATGLISVGVTSYRGEEIDAISEFVDEGGRVVVAANPQREFGPSGASTELYSELDAYTEPGYVYNLEENDLNYQRIFAEPAGRPMLSDGVDRVVFDTATPVGMAESDETMRPIAGSELSTTRSETEKPVLVRNNGVALVGDTGFMTPENTQRADNDIFVGNIAEFLVSGDRDPAAGADGGGESGEQAGAANGSSGEVVTVEVGPDGENVFAPQVTEIEPGTTVRFEWKSGGHNLVPVRQQPEGHEWDGVEEIQDEGYVHEFTFEEDSAHEFVSEPFREEMRGVVIVGNPDI